MAELKNGPLGTISGKVGNMVASNWRDISYLRAVGKKSNKEASLGQKEVQMKFNLLVDFLIPVKSILELGFQNKDTGRATALNLAVQKNIGAFKGVYPALELDYSQIVLSTGRLTAISGITTEVQPDGKWNITWKALTPEILAGASSDQLHIVMYSRTQNLHAYFANVARREQSQAELQIPEAFTGDELHAYFFLCSEKKDKSSASIYLPVI